MKLLIQHKVPYQYLPVGEAIDHEIHDVTYAGVESAISTLPEGLRCKKLVRPGTGKIADEILSLLPAGEKFDRVITVSGYYDEISAAAQLREALGAKGPRLSDLILSMDKVEMKKAVLAAGLRAPQFVPLRKLINSEVPPSQLWKGKTILKPTDGGASIGIEILSDPQSAVNKIAPKDIDRFEVEQYVEGPIWHFDGVLNDGKPLFMVASRYVGTCLEYLHGKPLGSVEIEQDGELCESVLPYLKATRIVDGAFHLEMIETSDGFVFMEVGARFGGSYVMPNLKLKLGIDPNFYDLAVKAGVGLGKLHLNRDLTHYYGWFLFPAHRLNPENRGKIVGSEPFKNHPAIVSWTELASDAPLPSQVGYEPEHFLLGGALRHEDPAFLENLMRRMFAEIRCE